MKTVHKSAPVTLEHDDPERVSHWYVTCFLEPDARGNEKRVIVDVVAMGNYAALRRGTAALSGSERKRVRNVLVDGPLQKWRTVDRRGRIREVID